MNFENLGLVELNAQEVETLDGGLINVFPVELHWARCTYSVGLMCLGILAGMGDGIRSGMNP